MHLASADYTVVRSYYLHSLVATEVVLPKRYRYFFCFRALLSFVSFICAAALPYRINILYRFNVVDLSSSPMDT